jgi:dimethylglycine dehydrogenase
MSNLCRHVDYGKGDFVGRAAALALQQAGAPRRVVTFAVASHDADAAPFTAVRKKGKVVGHVTSGAYGHHVQQSLAMAQVASDALQDDAGFTIDIVGEPTAAVLLPQAAYDPEGRRLRS